MIDMAALLPEKKLKNRRKKQKNRKSYVNLENTHDMAALLPLLLPMHPRNAAAAQLGRECCKIFWKARSSSSCLP